MVTMVTINGYYGCYEWITFIFHGYYYCTMINSTMLSPYQYILMALLSTLILVIHP